MKNRFLMGVMGVVALSMVACAPIPQDTTKELSTTTSDFGTGINAAVDYITDGDRTFVIIDLDNPNGRLVEVWLSQTYKSVGAESIRKRRIVTTNSRTQRQTIRASKLERGVIEIIQFEIFDSKGNSLFKTEPIENDMSAHNESKVAMGEYDPNSIEVSN